MDQVVDTVLRRQRTIQTVLLFVILTTLPFYCCGGLLLLNNPGRSNVVPSPLPTVTAFVPPTNTLYPSITPFILETASGQPLLPTPTQLILPIFPTATYITFATPTPMPPTYSPPTITPIIIFPPTSTPPVFPTSTPPFFPSPTSAAHTNAPPTPLTPIKPTPGVGH